MRILLALAISTAVGSASAAGPSLQPLDLDRPGVLEELKVERPRHHAAIVGVLRAAEQVPCRPGELETLKARFDISQLACSFLLMTSDPPKRRLSFELEGARYVGTVTLRDTRGHVVPARDDLPHTRK